MKNIFVKRLTFIFGIISILCGGGPVMAASPPGDVIGKVIVGYQGWFSGQNDGSPNGNWSHYSNNGLAPGSNNCVLVSWPDVRDYTTTYQTTFANLGNGQPAKLPSPWDQQTVTVHFQWMQQNGIDGAALQRFASWTTPGSTRKAQDDGIAARVKTAAEATGRNFFIMYDMSGTGNVTNDWQTTIVNTLHLTSSSSYAMQNGKPVVCLWGVCKTGRGSNTDWINTINGLTAQGCYVIGGVLHDWTSSTSSNGVVYTACDAIQPWMVGVIGTIAQADATYTGHIVPDMAYCSSHGLDYQMAVLPGDNSARQRLHGDLMWEQFYNAVRGGVNGIYISMFDEYNEGNQIAKTAEDSSMIPANATGGLALGLNEDGTACSSDYYLRLTGDGGKMLKGQIALTNVRPTPPTPATGARFYQDTLYGGTASQALPAGSYTQSQLAALGVPDNWASSVVVATGWTVTMYSSNNFTGTSWMLTTNMPTFTTLIPNANDQMTSCRVANGDVVFYQNTQYGGTASQGLPVGNYTTSQLAAKGMPNEWASSVRVPAGRTVIMYASDNFAGTSWTRTSDTPDFTILSPNANDQVSSVKVQ